MYEDWKLAHPELQGDENKVTRKKLVRGCCGKPQCDSYEEAMVIVAELPARPGRYLHAYLCPICKFWHWGNTSLALIGIVKREVLAQWVTAVQSAATYAHLSRTMSCLGAWARQQQPWARAI